MAAPARAAARRLARVLRGIAAPLIGVPTPLPARLAARHPELRTVGYRRGGLPPRVGGWCLRQRHVAAITLWRTVWLAPNTPFDEELLLHELRHVHQFLASRAFPLRYLFESVRRGYPENRYEVDARRYAAERVRAAAILPPSQDA